MSTLLKLAEKVESYLYKVALESVFSQLKELVSATYALFNARNEVAKYVDSGDMYGKENAKIILSLIDTMYFSASHLQKMALSDGIRKAEMQLRKDNILNLCDKASNFLQASGVSDETVASLGFNLVRAKAEALLPADLPGQPKAAPQKPETAPTETGTAFVDSDPTRFYRDDPTQEELDEALNLLRPKKEVNHSGIKEVNPSDFE